MKKDNIQFYSEGTEPIDGEDPRFFSKKIPIHPFSFLRLMPDNSIPESEKKFMPSVFPPTYLNEEELYSRQFDKKSKILEGSSLVICEKTGEVKMIDSGLISSQKSILLEIISKIGMSIFNSNRISFSVPISFCEPRTDLDRLAELYRIQGYYYQKAAKNTDRLERLKLVSTGFIGSMYMMLRKQKSLNPLWGETLQAHLEDGTEINVEQISHHPPISYHYAIGPKKSYISYGKLMVDIQFKGSYVLIIFDIKHTVRFRDGQTIELLKLPNAKITGIISGDRMAILKGMMIIEDKSIKLRSVIFFDYGEKNSLISSEKTVPKDRFEGIIYQSSSPTVNHIARSIAELDDIKKEVARLKGSWLKKIYINDVIYWDIDTNTPQKMLYSGNPLPSDSRFREDLVSLRRGNSEMGDQWKDALEIRQRRDRELRAKNNDKQDLYLH